MNTSNDWSEMEGTGRTLEDVIDRDARAEEAAQMYREWVAAKKKKAELDRRKKARSFGTV